MSRSMMIRDRQSSEQGRLLKCLPSGRMRVLMESGEIRDYQPKDLVGVLNVAEFDQNKLEEKRLRDNELQT